MRIVAILSPSADEKRRQFWTELWGRPRVPVTKEQPTDIIFPDGERGPGWFVDFDAIGAEGVRRFTQYTRERKNAQKVFEMVAQHGYPIRCDDVTIVTTADPEFWRELAMEGWL